MPTLTKRLAGIYRVGLVLLGCLVALVLAELGYRGWKLASGEAYDSDEVRAELQRAVEVAHYLPTQAAKEFDEGFGTAPQRRFLHPYLGWEQAGIESQFEQLLQRGPKGPREFELWILGGSVAEIFSQLGTPPVVDALAADPRLAGRNVIVYPFARGGWKMPQPLFAAQWLWMLGRRPDAIILIDGFNEVAIAGDNAARGAHPLYPSMPHWGTMAAATSLDLGSIRLIAHAADAREEAARIASDALGAGWVRSALLGRIALRRVRSLLSIARADEDEHADRLLGVTMPALLRGPAFARGPDEIMESAVRGWAECARELQQLCTAHGTVLVHVLQPTLHDPGSKPMTPREIELGAISPTWLRGVKLGYPRLREVGLELTREGVPIADASRLFVEDRRNLYFDACHFNERGNLSLGEWIAQRLLERLPPQ